MTMPSRRLRIALAAALLAPLGLLYWDGAARHARAVNTRMDATDQSAYMNYAGKVARSGHAHVGDRNRMPIYPFLLSFLHREGEPAESFFERGKRFNAVLSLLLLAVLSVVFLHRFQPLAALNLVLVTAFTVFIFKASYVQCELLYYTLHLCAFLAMCSLLRRPRWTGGLLAGGLAAAAHLTKAAMLPGVILFLVVLAVRGAWRALGGSGGPSRTGGPAARRDAGCKDITAAAATAVAFLAVLYPYISTSKRVFGRWFYNVNTTFYMWYDTHEEVMAGTRLAGDREGWPKLPEGEIPGMGRYLREHTPGQVARRLLDGLERIAENARGPYGWGRYLLLYAGLAAAAAALSARTAWRLARERAGLVLFVALHVAGYAVLYAWISATNSGVNRLTLQQFLPLLVTLAGAAAALDRPLLTWKGRPLSLVLLFNLVLLPLLAVEVHDVLARRIVTVYGGG